MADSMLARSPASAAMLDYWDQTDCLIDGVKAMRKAGEKFLPKFSDEESADYARRLQNHTKMTNVWRDIVEGLSTKPFEQEVSLIGTPPVEFQQFIENVDGAGNNLHVFAGQVFYNAINSAVDWILVDYPKNDPNIRTQADAKAAGLRPFWSRILGRNVLEATSVMIGSDEVLTHFRVFEPGSPDHVRVFERQMDGTVTWKLYRKDDKVVMTSAVTTQFVEVDAGVISIGVIPVVPFATGRRDGRTYRYFPALTDAADLQVELYQSESGLKFARVLTAYPMLAGNGVKPERNADNTVKRVVVGPNKVLFGGVDAAGNPGSWEYIEPGSESLKFLQTDIDNTIKEMRELGRIPLSATSGNLTVVSTSVAANKSRSAVKAWAYSLKDALENAMVLTAKYMGSDLEPRVSVFTEFDDFIDGKDYEVLIQMRAAGDISQLTLWEENKRRGLLSAEFSAEEELARLLGETPADEPDGTGQDDDTSPPTT